MEKVFLAKIIAIGVSLAIATGVGIHTYNIRKAVAETPVQVVQEEEVPQVQVQDTSEEPDYESEALSVYKNNKNSLSCDYSTFEEQYIGLRESGSSEESATQTALKKFAKAKVVEVEPEVISVEEKESPSEMIRSEVNKAVDFEIIPLENETKMYANSEVNIRSLPTTDSEIVGKLNKNDEVSVIGYVDSYKGEQVLWYQSSDNKFINGGFLVEKPITTANTEEKTASVTVTADATKKPKPQTTVPAQIQQPDQEPIQIQQQQPVQQQPVQQQPVQQQPAQQEEVYYDYEYDDWGDDSGANYVDITDLSTGEVYGNIE